MNELVTRALESGESKWLSDLPFELLHAAEIDMVGWILKYDVKYGEMPAIKAVMDEFEFFVPFIYTPSKYTKLEPMGAVFDNTVQEKLLSKSEGLLFEASTRMSKENEVPLDLLSEITKLHTTVLGAYRYSTFDRDLYFRRGKLAIPYKLINKQFASLSDGDFML